MCQDGMRKTTGVDQDDEGNKVPIPDVQLLETASSLEFSQSLL